MKYKQERTKKDSMLAVFSAHNTVSTVAAVIALMLRSVILHSDIQFIYPEVLEFRRISAVKQNYVNALPWLPFSL